MSESYHLHDFEQALAELRFDDAADLAASAPGERRQELVRQVETSRGQAQKDAQDLYARIVDHGSDGEQEAVAAIGDDHRTDQLLDCLPESYQRHARAYLGAAARWRAAQRKTSERRLAEAHRALEQFDLELAKGLARRVERRFLLDGEQLDRLFMDIEARAMEFQSLRHAQREIPEEDPSGKPPWWRRWRR